jgi:hypothetical protein
MEAEYPVAGARPAKQSHHRTPRGIAVLEQPAPVRSERRVNGRHIDADRGVVAKIGSGSAKSLISAPSRSVKAEHRKLNQL